MTEQMDVDVPTSSESLSTASSLEKLDPELHLGPLNDEMRDRCRSSFWRVIVEATEDDPSLWHPLISSVLMYLTCALAATDAKSSVIAAQNSTDAEAIVQGFNKKELGEWKVGVRRGVETNDWTSLITHPRLRNPNLSLRVSAFTIETPEEQAERLHDRFRAAYKGDAVEYFIKGIAIYDYIYDRHRYYGRSIAILQSSGTGKSRLVEELGSKIPTLSICFRANLSPRTGWPPSDEPAHRFLTRNRGDCEDHWYKGEELAAAFLGAVMAIVARKFRASSGSPKDWLKDWHLDTPTNIANSSRYRCFTEVEAKAENLLRENQSHIIASRFPTPLLGNDDTFAPADWHIRLFKCLCLPYATELAKVLKNMRQRYFILAFDECSELGLYQHPGGGRHPWSPNWGISLIALQRIIKAADTFSDLPITFWFLLLDTSSSIFDMVPHGPGAPSNRLTKELLPLPPWLYLGFNQMVAANVMAGIQKPTDVLSVQHSKTYGRPYWSILSNAEVVTAASEKLFFNQAFDPKNADHVLAAFSVRIGLEIGEGEASARLTMEAVRSHMRILTGVVGRLLVTTSPSEPMLAIAAADALNASNGTYRQAVETLLDKLILRGLILDRGLQGELYSRLLLMIARDKVTTRNGSYLKNDPTSMAPIVQAAPLSQFLQTLLGDNLGIPDAPANIPLPNNSPYKLRNKLLDETSNVWINFTHFIVLSKPIHEVTLSMLFEAWSSGFAFQCAFNQPVIDGLIVAYFGELDKPFNVSQLFVIPWQTKARSEAANLALSRQLTAPFLATSTPVRRKPEHLVILMDLGATSAFGSAKGPHCGLTFGKAEHPAGKGGRWDGYARSNEVEGDRYCLNIRGHGSHVYPVLQGFEERFDQLFQRSLACAKPEFVPFVEMMEQAMDRVKL